MKTTSIPFRLWKEKDTTSSEDMVHFYEEATEDYSFWSHDINMHFGYYTFGTSRLLARDSMLNEMNGQVYQRLQLTKGSQTVADLGCGMGGPMRDLLKRNSHLSMIGVTLSPFQVREGNKLLTDKKGVILQENYRETSISTASMDGAIGIESLCHDGHSPEALQEAYRILKPGARFVMCDAFIRKSPHLLSAGGSLSYRKLCKGWSLKGMGVVEEVRQQLLSVGFTDVKTEDISNRVAPSVLHVPFAIIGFLLKNMISGKPVKPQSWVNLRSSFFALLAGLHMKDFGYFLITATK
jgi:cyclopropane fatty-acyl-phospholipid synthase-like methyltransferase